MMANMKENTAFSFAWLGVNIPLKFTYYFDHASKVLIAPLLFYRILRTILRNELNN